MTNNHFKNMSTTTTSNAPKSPPSNQSQQSSTHENITVKTPEKLIKTNLPKLTITKSSPSHSRTNSTMTEDDESIDEKSFSSTDSYTSQTSTASSTPRTPTKTPDKK